MWPEVEKALSENRHELVLGGYEINQRLSESGLDLKIFDLIHLNYLDLHDTNLKGLPDDICKLKNLQSLVLNSNKIEAVNLNITKLEKLKLLDLSKNCLKHVPEELNKLSNIVTLNFTCNEIETFPKLDATHKLTVLDLSKNKLTQFPQVCQHDFNLAELKLNDNQIEAIPPEIRNLTNLKVLELGKNKIKAIPGELILCTKLKVLELKNNPIADRRLLKLIDQCRIKQILDYVKSHSPKVQIEIPKNEKSIEIEEKFDHIVTVHYAKDNLRVVIDDSIKNVREYFIGCIIHNVKFNEDSFKKFIQIQNKLHETVCSKRNLAAIATHDFNKLPPGDLLYTTLPPNELEIHPLNRAISMTGAELFAKLQTEANNLRKEKKRNTYSGIHKYLYLIEGQAKYPCLLNSEKKVISFPPITNSEVSKIHPETNCMFVEVTSTVSLHCCKVAIEALIKELIGILDCDLEVTQVKTIDVEGNLKNVYPSKANLHLEGIKVVRD